MKSIADDIYNKLEELGVINAPFTRTNNVGTSDYSNHTIQPWSIWIDWNLNPFDADIIKRVLRTKQGTDRKEDYLKIIHVCEERIRQIEIEEKHKANTIKFDDTDNYSENVAENA